MTDFETTPIYADTASRQSDGTGGGTSGGASLGTRMIVGTNVGANGYHLMLRFLTGAVIPSAETIVKSKLRLNVATANTPSCGVYTWASEFGTTVDENDYNKAASNVYEGGTVGTLRVKLKKIVVASVALSLNQLLETPVPSRFIQKGGSLKSDFEVRPDVVGVPLAGDTITIYGPSEVTLPLNKPRLAGVSLTDTELRSQNAYRFPAIGAETYLAIGIETTAGVAVKPYVLMDIRSSTMDNLAENIPSQSLTSQRVRPRKIAIGREGAGGDFVFELTPEKWDLLLRGMLKKISTSGPDANGVYTHVFKVCQSSEIAFYTVLQKMGAFRQLYPGCALAGLSFDCSLDELVTATASFAGRSEYEYADDSMDTNDGYVLGSTAAYDSVANGLYSFVGGLVEIDGGSADARCIRSASVSMRQTVNEKRGLTRQRYIQGHYALGMSVEINFSMYFEHEQQLRKFLGVSHRDFPFAAEKSIQFQAVKVRFEGSLGAAKQELILEMPKLVYTVVRKPLNNEDAIMLDASAVALFDESSSSNLIVTLLNSEPGTTWDPSTDYITVLPAGR